MSISGLFPIVLALAVSLIAAGVVIAGLWFCLFRRPLVSAFPSQPSSTSAVFLFESGVLTDASPAARRMIAAIRSDAPNLSVVAGHLARRFPGLRDHLRQVEERGTAGPSIVIDGANGGDRLHVDGAHGHLRLTVETAAEPDDNRVSGLEEENRSLRSLAEDSPQLIWQQEDDGRLAWANRAYLALADRSLPRTHAEDPLWPVEPVLPTIGPVAEDGATVIRRAQIELPGTTEPRTFEVTSVRRGGATMHFAIDASNTIAAEEGRQKFVQTLTKTFAHLSAGLAIFDRDRRLVLFNPAFLDLTTLPALFLSQRPFVGEVLDRLRDLQMLPEPKNYSSWRDRVAALEAAAVRGTYCETWSLPSGRTYRVSGRPHPDGGIAFLFEDVSDEIHLTRRFRSELETAQAVLDSLEEAVAIFSQAGTMTMSNTAYSNLWGRTTSNLSELGLTSEIENWQSRSLPSPLWDRLCDSMADPRDRSRWEDHLRLADGRSLVCRFHSLPGGASLVAFRPATAGASRLGRNDHGRRPRAVAGR